jgi:hypothetical protein
MLRNIILRDIRKIDNPAILNHLFEYLQLLKKNVPPYQGNAALVLRFAGSISGVEAARARKVVEQEFSKIEGEW